jgi:6-phosphogluconolactonase
MSRRALLRCAVAISASGPLLTKAREPNGAIKYVTTAESIDVYRTQAGQSRRIQSLPSQHPSSLTLDITGRYLFAVNDIDEFQGFPTGSVESYEVAPRTGKLNRISRSALSLSATTPRQLALSPDGRHFVVAVYGGGLYNVLSVRPNGEIGGITQVLKEIGHSIRRGPQSSAHPHSIVFHPSGEFVIGTDTGADRVNVFRIRDGQMTCVQRLATVPGAGPAGLTLDASGSDVVVEHKFSSSVARYQFDSRSGTLLS